MPDQQIEQRGIDRLHFVLTPVAQDEVDLAERAGNVFAVGEVGGLEALAGMQIVER